MKFNKIEPKTFSQKIYDMDGISKKTIEEHLQLYLAYVNKYNEINEALTNLADKDYDLANQTYSLIRSLKVDLTFAYGGVISHEIYFDHLGGSGKEPTGTLKKQIEADFGSFVNYQKDMLATGMAARGWVWTAWNTREQRLVNYLGDSQNAFPVWNAVPIVALDTYEHSYFIDYGRARAKYIDAFFKNLNWTTVEKNFEKLTSRTSQF